MSAAQVTHTPDIKITRREHLVIGNWYALVDEDAGIWAAMLGQYVGDGEFADEDGSEYRDCEFDYFVPQGGAA
jgi:hypothetical protein